MDEGTSQGRQALESGGAGEQRAPEEIRRDIEETRAKLGDTVEAIAEKVDVKRQAKDRIADLRQTVREKTDEFVSKAKASNPDGDQAGARQMTTKAQENPLPFAVAGALAAGFIVGRFTAR